MKVAVLGAAGGIGQALTLLLKNHLPVDSILSLYDISPITPGVAVDLSHIPTAVKVEGFTGKNITPTLHGADIVLIAAGIARKPGMDRNDLFKFNASIVRDLVTQLTKICPETLIAIITNPVNSTVAIAAEVLKKAGVYNRNKLFGITTLDSMRSNTFVAKLKGKQPQNIIVPVIGGHSELTILPLLSQIPDIIFTKEEIINLTKCIRDAGTEVVKSKSGGGSATLSMGEAAARFTLSLVYALQGASNVIEYAYVDAVEKDGKYKYAPFFAQPILLDKYGIAERKDLGILSHYEQEELQRMLKVLNEDIISGKDFINLFSL